MKTFFFLALLITLPSCEFPDFTKTPPPEPPAWSVNLKAQLEKLSAQSQGNFGVYVKKIGSNEEMNFAGDRNWYLASTIKVPVAIALLQLVESKKLKLNQQLTLKTSDFVDGSGEVQFRKPGSKLTLSYLMEKMLTQSDSTATDMLIRLIGEDELNSMIRTKMGVDGFQPITTILQVRKDAFGNLHPKAGSLTNRNFIDLKRHKSNAAKLKAISRMTKIPTSKFHEKSIEAAFEKYYLTGLNSGSLKSFGFLLEKLHQGELLSKAHTDLILKYMSNMTTGENRIKAGLPKGLTFAQKTGTQVSRICNVGVLYGPQNFAIAACMEKFKNFAAAEKTLAEAGKLIGQAAAGVAQLN